MKKELKCPKCYSVEVYVRDPNLVKCLDCKWDGPQDGIYPPIATLQKEKSKVPKVTDILDPAHVAYVLQDANTHALSLVEKIYKKGVAKAPIKIFNFVNSIASSNIIGHMQAVEGLMDFLENSEIIDGLDPKHDMIQSLYGELCMFLLKLDKLLYGEFKIKSNINNTLIEKRAQEYLDKFFHKRERINELQQKMKEDNENISKQQEG